VNVAVRSANRTQQFANEFQLGLKIHHALRRKAKGRATRATQSKTFVRGSEKRFWTCIEITAL